MFKAFCDECGDDVELAMPDEAPPFYGQQAPGHFLKWNSYTVRVSIERRNLKNERIDAHLCLSCIGKMAEKVRAEKMPVVSGATGESKNELADLKEPA